MAETVFFHLLFVWREEVPMWVIYFSCKSAIKISTDNFWLFFNWNIELHFYTVTQKSTDHWLITADVHDWISRLGDYSPKVSVWSSGIYFTNSKLILQLPGLYPSHLEVPELLTLVCILKTLHKVMCTQIS